jgi:hypothetical protein
MVFNLFSIHRADPFTRWVTSWDLSQVGNNIFLFYEWPQISGWPVALKALVLPFWAACVVVSLITINNAQRLFTNFKKDLVFHGQNIRLIANMSKLLIALAIVTWNFSTVIVSILLLIVCQIFRHGTALQEDHDLTV